MANAKDVQALRDAVQAYADRGEVHPGVISAEQARYNHEVVFPELVRRASEPGFKFGYVGFDEMYG